MLRVVSSDKLCKVVLQVLLAIYLAHPDYPEELAGKSTPCMVEVIMANLMCDNAGQFVFATHLAKYAFGQVDSSAPSSERIGVMQVYNRDFVVLVRFVRIAAEIIRQLR